MFHWEWRPPDYFRWPAHRRLGGSALRQYALSDLRDTELAQLHEGMQRVFESREH